MKIGFIDFFSLFSVFPFECTKTCKVYCLRYVHLCSESIAVKFERNIGKCIEFWMFGCFDICVDILKWVKRGIVSLIGPIALYECIFRSFVGPFHWENRKWNGDNHRSTWIILLWNRQQLQKCTVVVCFVVAPFHHFCLHRLAIHLMLMFLPCATLKKRHFYNHQIITFLAKQ